MNFALVLAHCRGDEVRLAAAGMPPALLYRAGAASIEEVLLAAPPLGAFAGFSYPEREISPAAGDTVLLSTDGLPERLNPRDEPLGYPAVAAGLLAAGREPLEVVLDRLFALGDEWAGGRAQDDDVTLVLLRRGNESVAAAGSLKPPALPVAAPK